jgi:hypothetical protein
LADEQIGLVVAIEIAEPWKAVLIVDPRRWIVWHVDDRAICNDGCRWLEKDVVRLTG